MELWLELDPGFDFRLRECLQLEGSTISFGCIDLGGNVSSAVERYADFRDAHECCVARLDEGGIDDPCESLRPAAERRTLMRSLPTFRDVLRMISEPSMVELVLTTFLFRSGE